MGDIITKPFAWVLLNLYEMVNNFGWAIILFAVVVKLVLLPFQMKSKRSTMRTTRLQPIMQELQKKYEGNQQKYQEEVARLYKEEKINPMSGCIWSLIPFPIVIALYSVVRQPLSKLMGLAAEEVTAITDRLVSMGLYTIPERTDAYYEITLSNLMHGQIDKFTDISDKLIDLNYNFLGMNLSLRPELNFFSHVDWSDTSSWAPALGLFLIPFISAFLSWLSMKVAQIGNPTPQGNDAAAGSMKGMMIMMPLMSVWICFVMPGALGVYWIMGSILGMIQDVILNKHYGKILDAEDAERKERLRKREEELEQKRLETERLREQGLTERNKNTSKKRLQKAEKDKNDKRLAAERSAEKAKRKAELGIKDEIPASQVGNRRYARGRAYVPDRFTNPEGAEEATREAAAASEIDDEVDREFAVDEKEAVDTLENVAGDDTPEPEDELEENDPEAAEEPEEDVGSTDEDKE